MAHLRSRQLVLRQFSLFSGFEVKARSGQFLLLIGFPVIAQRKIDIERKRARSVPKSLEDRFCFANLLYRQRGSDRSHTVGGLCGLDFQEGFFCRRFFASLEVLPDTEAVEPAGNSP